jgi:hypothetical protein
LSRKTIRPLLYLLIFAAYVFSIACNSSERSGKPEQPAVANTSSTSSQVEMTPAVTPETASEEASAAPAELPPPPKPEEVSRAVARVYKDAVAIDVSSPPGYIVGDFNGDGSQDLAVVVRPAKGKLEEINSEVANWIMEDPRKVALPDPHKSVQPLPPRPAPVKAEADDLLLTIIHGYKQEGWRNPAAQQAYMLYDAVGSSMTPVPLKELQRATKSKSELSKSGDVIKQTLEGEPGFLYWTGAKYAWHKRQ